MKDPSQQSCLPARLSLCSTRLSAAPLATELSLGRLSGCRRSGCHRCHWLRATRRLLLLQRLLLGVAADGHAGRHLGQAWHRSCGLLRCRLLLDCHHLQTADAQLSHT